MSDPDLLRLTSLGRPPPQLRRWVWLTFVCLSASGCVEGNGQKPPTTAETEAERRTTVASASAWTEFTPLQTVGSTEHFGEVTAALVTGDRRILALDAMRGRVSMFDFEGALKDAFGRKGLGPGEFFSPVGITLGGSSRVAVLDEANLRMSILEIEHDSIALVEEFRMPFRGRGLCSVNGDLYVSGAHDGYLLHQMDWEGNVVSSFHSLRTHDRFDQIIGSLGQLVCDQQTGLLAHVSRMKPSVLLLSTITGSARVDTIPGFAAIVYDRSNNAIQPTTPPEGFYNENINAFWLNRRLVVQMRRSDSDPQEIESHILDPSSGSWTKGPSWPPVKAVADSFVLAAVADPFPVLRAYRAF